MISFYGGDDTFESLRKAKEAIQNLANKTQCEIKIIEAGDLQKVDSFLQEIEGVDMFSSEKIFFVKRIFSNKALVEFISENFARINNYNIVFWHDSKPDSRTSFVKYFKSQKRFYEFEAPREPEVKNFTVLEAKKMGIRLSPANATYIVEKLGTDKGIIFNELKKIELFTSSKNINILTNEQLERILGFDVKGDIWKFLDYFGKRQKEKAIHEYFKLSKYEDNGQYIIAMLERELRLIAMIKFAKEQSISPNTLKLNPYVVKKTSEKTVFFSKADISNFSKRLLQIDLDIKNGNIEEKSAIVLFLNEV